LKNEGKDALRGIHRGENKYLGSRKGRSEDEPTLKKRRSGVNALQQNTSRGGGPWGRRNPFSWGRSVGIGLGEKREGRKTDC